MRLNRLPRFGTLLTALALAAPLSARADTPDDQYARDHAEGIALANDALVLARKGDFEGARELYAKAFDKYANTSILFNWGLAELHSGHPLDALRHLRFYMREHGAEPSKVTVIQKELLPKAMAATGHIAIDRQPPGTELTLDDHSAPQPDGDVLDVLPGTHNLTAKGPGDTWRATVTVAAGERASASFEHVVEANAPVPPPPVVLSPPILQPTTLASPHQPPVREPFWDGKTIAGFSIIGVAVATGGVALGFLIDSMNADARVTSLGQYSGATCTNPGPSVASQCAAAQAATDEKARSFTAAQVLYGASMGILVTSFVVYELWPEPKKKTAAFSVRPSLDPASRAVGIVGRF